MKKVAVVGGGSAGFLAAITAAQNSHGSLEITVYEKSEPLKTLLYTGGGRCNLANATYDFKELARNYPRGEKFLYSVFSRFGTRETEAFFKESGVRVYTQPDKRVFPVSDDANTVRDCLLTLARTLKIQVKSGCGVDKIEKTSDKFKVYSQKGCFDYDIVVISTGGNSKNSEYSGYGSARKLGHNVTDLKPSLAGFVTAESWVKNVAGVSINDVKLEAWFNGKRQATFIGDLLFTHKGVSGPVVFKTSAACAYLDYNRENPLVLKLNMASEYDKSSLDKLLLDLLDKNSQKGILNLIKDFAPKSLLNELLLVNGIDSDNKASQVTKRDRQAISSFITELSLNVISTQPDGEMVTAGGVDLKQVDSKTMQSKLVQNLYFCGEVLDIDGFTGGFNLQACWSTGYVAGLSVSEMAV